MKPELDKQLCEKYPEIFSQRYLPMNQTCMFWGLEVDDGWYDLIDSLCGKLEAIRSVTGITTTATQVKEKYAELRFYNSASYEKEDLKIKEDELKVWWDIIDAVVEEASARSANICEVCGGYGHICKSGGWYKALCTDHAKELGYVDSKHPYDEDEPKAEEKLDEGSTG